MISLLWHGLLTTPRRETAKNAEKVPAQTSHLAVRGDGLEAAVGQRHELVVTEEVRSFPSHDFQHLHRQLANFDLRVPAGALLDEIPQRPRVGRDENLGLG